LGTTLPGADDLPTAVVIGPVGRDLVLVVDELPDPGTSTLVRSRTEVLGGKGANQAVSFARLGAPVALVGVVGDDAVGDDVLAWARADGIDVSAVARRAGTPTGLIVEILDREGRWRYLEDLRAAARLEPADIAAAAPLIARAGSVAVQLQQPSQSALAAVSLAHRAGCRIVLDGVPEPDCRHALMTQANVLRADAREAELLTGLRIAGADDALRAAHGLLRHGLSLVALAVEGEGNLFAWPEGHVFLPFGDAEVVDTTGAGDALVAALTTALDRGLSPDEAALWAVAAASLEVEHAGGRPHLTLGSLLAKVEDLRGREKT
jgi:ribokinase